MNLLLSKEEMNLLYSKVVEAEDMASDADLLASEKYLSRILDYPRASDLHTKLWHYYKKMSKLDDELDKRVIELMILKDKKLEDPDDIFSRVGELLSLSRRVGAASATVLGAIAKTTERESALAKEIEDELERLKKVHL